jgi:outer membrane protein W/transglutaminase-like putative cysteine protease
VDHNAINPNSRKRAGLRITGVLLWLCCCLAAVPARAQGITRSTGIGLRGSFWKVPGRTSGIRVNTLDNSASVDVEGFGGCLTFFSRLRDNWFMESSLGTASRVHSEEKWGNAGDVDVSALIPFLIGVRYDFLTGRVRSAIQPYLCAGAGVYWLAQTSVQSSGALDASVSIGTDSYFGGYAGAGVHVSVSSWFALNADARTHFVDFSRHNSNSGYELGFGFCFAWGRQREIFRVRSVKVIVEDLYPAYYRFYNTYPLAMAVIENTAGFPIEVNLRSWIDGVTDGVRQSGFVSIPAGETRDFPVYLLFGRGLLLTETREPAVIQLEIEARAGTVLKKNFSAQVTVHSRNAWNGEIDKLPVFVTPDDSTIHALARSVLRNDTAASLTQLRKFRQAHVLFESLKGRGLRYQSDPNIPFDKDDRVQAPSRTLALGMGDCDDLSVLAASLFESAGISTAFVDVHDPSAEQGHVYLLFDTGLAPEQWTLVSANEKRTVVRTGGEGRASLWVPLETTLIPKGFEEAWKQAATQYEEEGMLRQGLAEGWVRIIDID